MHARAADTTIEELDARMGWSEEERVIAWRIEALMRAGYDERAAVELSECRHVDLCAARQLIEAGCPVGTALRILR